MLKTVGIGTRKYTEVFYKDDVGPGDVYHEYFISPAITREDTPAGEFGHVRFQNGPIGETGVNGCHNEDLLAIVIHRLQCFQAGEYGRYKCRENAIAITKLEEALMWLNKRTSDRIARGVEGTSNT